MKNLLFLMMLALPSATIAQGWGYDNNRIAISADGNNADDYKDKWLRADPDDWGGTPAAMAMIAKANKYDQLVHFSYNNFVEGNVAMVDENVMHINVQSGIERLHFNPDVFFDGVEQFDEAKSSLKAEMAKSTANDPLYFVHMGPSEFFYQCVKECVDEGNGDALAHVYVVSHSGYNENHLRRPYHHTMAQAIEYSGGKINFKRIKDQNGHWDPHVLWCSGKNFEVWRWMLTSEDPNIWWLYDCLDDHPRKVADISDAGMVFYLLTGDDNGRPSKFREFLGDEIVPNSFVHAESISTDVDDLLVYVGYTSKITATILPKLASNKRVSWSSSNERVATVDLGVVRGVKPGRATITATSKDGDLESVIHVTVKKLSLGEESIVLNAIDDFEDIEIEGFVPAYKDIHRKAIAVDAVHYKDKFANARCQFEGKSGLYDLTLTTMRELDGESKYRVRVDGRLVGEFRNETTKKDYVRDQMVMRKVTIRKGDIIQIESNSSSNFRIPEGKAFAFSRGRWNQIAFAPADLEAKDESMRIINIGAADAKLKGKWELKDDNIASKGKCIVYTGSNAYKVHNDENTIEFKFKVDEAGTYCVKWLMRQPEGQFGSDLGNDAWIDFVDAVQLANGKEIEDFISL